MVKTRVKAKYAKFGVNSQSNVDKWIEKYHKMLQANISHVNERDQLRKEKLELIKIIAEQDKQIEKLKEEIIRDLYNEIKTKKGD